MLPREISLAARRRLAEPADVYSSAGGSPKGTAVFRVSSEPRGANSVGFAFSIRVRSSPRKLTTKPLFLYSRLQVFNAHLQGFANQVESLRSSGRLSGGERGALAEALLAVAAFLGEVRLIDNITLPAGHTADP